MSQKFYVAANRTVHGPVTNRKREVNPKLGRVAFSGMPGPIYPSGSELPNGFVDFAQAKRETNGHTLLENLIDGGWVVFEPNTRSPVTFAPLLPIERQLTPENSASKADLA
jgi:hypothetical protein